MIKLIRLVTGDDVICEIERKGEVVVLKKPHRLIFSREGLASMPLCPFAKSEDYEISAQNVLFEAEPEDEIKNSYLNQIGAIILPNSGLLTP
jgi:hypothetical protein